MVPFSRAEFYQVFERYNESVWPAQIFLYLLAIFAVVIARKRTDTARRSTYVLLGLLWIWMAVVYHARFFSAINPLAWLFAVLFAMQGLLFVAYALVWNVEPRSHAARQHWLGTGLVILGLAVYPLAAIAFGDSYPALPTFGLPCPTTIFTLGILLLLPYRVPAVLFGIPILWTLIGLVGAVQLSVKEDAALIVATLTALVGRRFPLRPEEGVVSTG